LLTESEELREIAHRKWRKRKWNGETSSEQVDPI
jgi:hypothetical protein